MTAANPLLQVVCFALTVYWLILIVRIIFSWIPSVPEPIQPLARLSRVLTDPVLNPVRGLFPALRTGAMAIDFSPILVFVAIWFLRGLLCT
jgi:YggT family protein